MSMIGLTLAVLVLSAGLSFYWVLRRKKAHHWAAAELMREARTFLNKKPKRKTHVIFALVDHFEPGNGGVDRRVQEYRVDEWIRRYPTLADRHLDADGVVPQHTFFFPPHYDHADHLGKIVALCAKGYGEVEMHLHHDRQLPWPDDEQSLEGKVRDCVERFGRHGVFRLPDGRVRFGFIHGDWALANSLERGAHCGVNDEISVLTRNGCFADFTFPACNEAQPRWVNTLFYGASERSRGKGYDRICRQVRVGNQERKGILFVQGVMGFRWKSRTHRFWPSIEQSNLDRTDCSFPARTKYWVDKAIHVQGRPEWVFVKVHTHGAREIDWPVLLGEAADALYANLERDYNDGGRYALHYVTAREMYNIIRAAEDGRCGNPAEYRDYEIPRYRYLPPRNIQAAGRPEEHNRM